MSEELKSDKAATNTVTLSEFLAGTPHGVVIQPPYSVVIYVRNEKGQTVITVKEMSFWHKFLLRFF